MNAESYLSISKGIAQYRDYKDGKLWQQVYGVMGGSLVQLLAEGKILPEYFQQDYATEVHFQLSEQIANWININLLAEPECQSLREKLNESPDHGRDHFRRLEKWYKKAQAKDKSIRTDTAYLYFSPSAFLSEKMHDLVESYSGQKEKHDGAAALMALGYVLRSLPLAHDVVRDFSDGKYTDFPSEEWVKIAWGTAFMCLHHSKPELMPSTDDLLARQAPADDGNKPIGIFDPKELLNAAEYMMQEANKKKLAQEETPFRTVEEFFPPYALIRTTIQAIQNGTLEVPVFNELEIEGLKKQTRLFAAADKLDSTYPADLSAVRTFQTRPERVFFLRMEREMELEEELEERIKRGAGHESPCDLDRFLFEMTRTKTFDDMSLIVKRWYANGLRMKAQFLYEGISALLESDSAIFLRAYEHMERDMARAILIKAGYEEGLAAGIATIHDRDLRRVEVEDRLESQRFDPGEYEAVLYRIRDERARVESIINNKMNSLFQMDITVEEKERIRKLLVLARVRQSEGLRWMPGPTANEPLPYVGYILVQLTKIETNT